MASSITFGGLASGLDTNSIIDSLVQLQSAPIAALQKRQGGVKSQVSLLGDLASKLAALMLAITLTTVFGAVVAYAFGGIAYGYAGWRAPVLTGFRIGGQSFDPAGVRSIELWKDTVLVFGLAWFAMLCVGAIALLTSVLLRSTAASMGTMLAALIAGTILPRLASSWEAQKFLFVTNLPLPDYYSGSPPPIPGLSVAFAATVLGAWAVAALAAAFLVFVRRDVLA